MEVLMKMFNGMLWGSESELKRRREARVWEWEVEQTAAWPREKAMRRNLFGQHPSWKKRFQLLGKENTSCVNGTLKKKQKTNQNEEELLQRKI